MPNTEITKKEIHDELEIISNSARVVGAEGISVDLKIIIDRIKKDL